MRPPPCPPSSYAHSRGDRRPALLVAHSFGCLASVHSLARDGANVAGADFGHIFAVIGMSVSSPEAANGVGFTLIFPITFISSAFVPVESMPAGLRHVAEANPVSQMVDAIRALWLGGDMGNSLWLSVVWTSWGGLRPALGNVQTRPGRRSVSSWSSQRLPSGSLNDAYEA